MVDSTTGGPTPGYPRKRARTRRALIDAGMTVLARRGPDGTTVGEIASEAGVSSATFYNHFPSLLDLVDSITIELRSGVEIGHQTLSDIENDPAVRIAIGTVQLLRLASEQPPAAAAFASLLASVPSFRVGIREIVGSTIAAGVESGALDVAAPGPATDAVLGAVVQWMRSGLAGEQLVGTEPERVDLVLRLLGVPADRIAPIVERALVVTTP